MFDIKLIRENIDAVKAMLKKRASDIDVDQIAAIDAQYRELVTKVENMRAERNRLSKECKNNPAARDQVKALKEEMAVDEEKLSAIEAELNDKLSWMPNMIAADVPDGKDDQDNVELRKVGEIRNFDFPVRDHQELGEMLDIIDTQRGAKVAQSGFYYWKGKGALLVQSLFFWVQRELVKRGFTDFMTPCVAKSRTLFGTGYLPFFADQTYNLSNEDLALIGTSEQTLVGYHADEVLDGDKLPNCYTAYTPCFRTESGSYGKASKGIFRVHQFHKVEQIIFCK
ncbi:MAG: aminoacyl--tRNA ligase-related protein, partial [Victivallaceae bacterium]